MGSRAGVRGARQDLRRDACGHRADGRRCRHEIGAQYVLESRKDKGAVRVEAYIQVSRINHLTLVEVWENRQALEAHEAAAHTKKFREQIDPLLGSPYDERLHTIAE